MLLGRNIPFLLTLFFSLVNAEGRLTLVFVILQHFSLFILSLSSYTRDILLEIVIFTDLHPFMTSQSICALIIGCQWNRTQIGENFMWKVLFFGHIMAPTLVYNMHTIYSRATTYIWKWWNIQNIKIFRILKILCLPQFNCQLYLSSCRNKSETQHGWEKSREGCCWKWYKHKI